MTRNPNVPTANYTQQNAFLAKIEEGMIFVRSTTLIALLTLTRRVSTMQLQEPSAFNLATTQPETTFNALADSGSSQLMPGLDRSDIGISGAQTSPGCHPVQHPTSIPDESTVPQVSMLGADFSFLPSYAQAFAQSDQTFPLPADGVGLTTIWDQNGFEIDHQDFLVDADDALLNSTHYESHSTSYSQGFDLVDYSDVPEAINEPTESTPARPATSLPQKRLQSSEVLADEEDEMTVKLTARYASLKITDNGQPRYYGATSNMHMLGDQVTPLFQPAIRSPRHDADTILKQLGLDWEPDPSYEEHLFNLYFAWHDPFMQEAHKQLFFRGRKAYELGVDMSFYSPSLENAMSVFRISSLA